MANPTKIVWRGLLWLLPFVLILLGLVFVYRSITTGEKAQTPSGPANLREVSENYADTWARRQVSEGVTVTSSQLDIVDSKATSASTYTVFALVAQVNDRAGEQRTVLSCVHWRIDVVRKLVDELHASMLRSELGSFPKSFPKELRERCNIDAFP